MLVLTRILRYAARDTVPAGNYFSRQYCSSNIKFKRNIQKEKKSQFTASDEYKNVGRRNKILENDNQHSQEQKAEPGSEETRQQHQHQQQDDQQQQEQKSTENENQQQQSQEDSKQANTDRNLMIRGSFEHITNKNRENYLMMIKMFEHRDVHRKNHVEFIYAALKHMREFGVERDLSIYKALIDIMPKGKFIPTNVFQAEFVHYPKQQQCIIDLLDEMEYNGE